MWPGCASVDAIERLEPWPRRSRTSVMAWLGSYYLFLDVELIVDMPFPDLLQVLLWEIEYDSYLDSQLISVELATFVNIYYFFENYCPLQIFGQVQQAVNL
jgi:hypothetical protein